MDKFKTHFLSVLSIIITFFFASYTFRFISPIFLEKSTPSPYININNMIDVSNITDKPFKVDNSPIHEITLPVPIPETSITENEDDQYPQGDIQTTGVVIEKTYTENSSDIKLEYGYLKNCTNSSKDKILSTANQKPKFKISKNSQPQVLIMHSHTTESFLMSKTDTYIKDQSFRTTDNNKNISSVGKIIAQELKQAGISVIHDTTQHDYPAYPGSYERSRETVMRILKEYPSIKIVLDIHRDAIVPDNNSIIAPVCTINGEKYAQVMIISGYDDGTMNMPKCMENLKLACLIQSQMEKDYPTLTRPILFDYRKYNQDLTTGSLLIEVGGHGNTLQEVQNSGKLIGKSISKALFSY